jgi:hypothetical protein
MLAQIVPRSLMTRKVPVPVTGAYYRLIFSFVLPTCFSFSGIWGFLFSDSFFNYLAQESSNVIAGADPVMSSEVQGGLPPAQTTH